MTPHDWLAVVFIAMGLVAVWWIHGGPRNRSW